MPEPKSRATQRFCSARACRKASKARSTALWREKNPGYDRGPEQVARVQRWRAAHPGYYRGKGSKSAGPALQDLDPAQVAEVQPLAKQAPGAASDLFPCEPAPVCVHGAPGDGALQDLDGIQLPLVVGLVLHLAGGALQESLGPVARHLVEQGQRALAQNPDLFGLRGALQKNTQPDLHL